MTIQTELGRDKKFVCSVLPWLIAAAALVIYLLTLNSWVSLMNLTTLAKTAGWVPSTMLYAPLYNLLTYPFRWLPPTMLPVAYNLFSLVCAVLILALLARSVALWPYDRTENQRVRERSRLGLLSLRENWIPPVVAVAVCGLQLSFWEAATAGSSDLLDLLLVAYVIRCLLEFRIDKRDSWILRASLVCGLGMANGWVMFCMAPLFVISLIWIKRLEFFNPRFLLKASLFALAGMLLYLVLPLIHVASGEPGSFWQALKANLQTDKVYFTYLLARAPKNRLLLLMLGSFLPLLVISIRWASNFGDPSRVGSSLATWAFHTAHLALLAVCIWIAFGSVISPRHLVKTVGGIAPLGPLNPVLYYLGALSIGYLCGYFLLVFLPPIERTLRRNTMLEDWLRPVFRVVIWLVLVVVPPALVYRNLPQIRMTNGPSLKQYATMMQQSLPPHCVVLSDDSFKLFLVQARMPSREVATNYLFLDTQALAVPRYHGIQQKLHPDSWIQLVDPASQRINPLTLVALMAKFSERMPVYYLHPSFGYYFEFFYPEPHGLTSELKLYSTNATSVFRAPLTDAEIAENEKFWNDQQSEMARLRRFIREPAPSRKPGVENMLLKKFHIPSERNATAVALGAIYSQSLNSWGVELQRAGRLKEAGRHFETAVALYADNSAAKANLELNQELQAGKKVVLRVPKTFEEEFRKYSSWDQVLRETGPYDDPTHCYGAGMTFSQAGLPRQSAQQFARVHQLVPENLEAQLWLTRLYIANRLPDRALEMVASLRSVPPDALNKTSIKRLDLFGLQATALLIGEKPEDADEYMQNTMREEPNNQDLLMMVVQLGALFKRYTNSLIAIDRQLEIKPDDLETLRNKGVFNLQIQRYSEAVAPLERVYSAQTNNPQIEILLATAYLNSDDTENAEKHFEYLQKLYPNQPDVSNGLGEIAWRRKDTNTALMHYETLLTNLPPTSDQINRITERINSLKGQ